MDGAAGPPRRVDTMTDIAGHVEARMRDDDPLFVPIELGEIDCSNRMVMAPMTRSRASAGGLVNGLHVEYYGERASAGLIVTEGTQPSIHGKGYCRTPGLHDVAQVAAWRRVTDRVHAEGSRIVVQLMHVGRVASRHNKQADARTVAPSAVRARVQMYTDVAGMQDCDEPEALTLAEIPAVVEEYTQAARFARGRGSTASSSTRRAAICRCSFSSRTATGAAMPMAAWRRTACVSPSK